jgi:hypothetical protein
VSNVLSNFSEPNCTSKPSAFSNLSTIVSSPCPAASVTEKVDQFNKEEKETVVNKISSDVLVNRINALPFSKV